MGREPKVACVEIDCPYRDWPKSNELCEKCKPRWKYLKAIENGWTIPCYPSDDTPILHRFPFDAEDWRSIYGSVES